MKKFMPTLLVIFAMIALVLSFTTLGNKPSAKSSSGMVPTEFPEEISLVLQTSCYDCHISESSNIKAKGKLNFSKWEELSEAKKVGKLESIAEEVKEGKMPPSRYLDNNPKAALSKEQVEAILKWTEEETNKIMGE